MSDKWYEIGGIPEDIERSGSGDHPSPQVEGIEPFTEGVNVKKYSSVNTEYNPEPPRPSSSYRESASKDPQVVVRLTLRVAKDEAATVIEELRKSAKGDISFEVPQSSLPISGLVQWNHKIVGSRVQKWVSVTGEG